MSGIESFSKDNLAIWNLQEQQFFRQLNSPFLIQTYLDNLPYSDDSFYRSPRRVMQDGKAHCFDGALFTACALQFIGHRPLIVDIFADNDDDHLLAIYKVRNYWGAVAKSNFVGLRFREPGYRNLRELVLSYFESYYNLEKEKTMRGYTVPLDLSRFYHLQWMTSDQNLEQISDALDRIRHINILTPAMIKELNPVDERSYRAGMLGVNEAGLYRPDKNRH
mgnify:CR=1 FL=1